MNQTGTFSNTARWLHWLTAGLIVLQYVLAGAADDAASDLQALALLAQHKSVGITVLALAIIRLIWRLTNGAPPWPSSMPRWQHLASTISHWTFYALIIALPLSGWLLSSAAAYSVSWFNLVPLPDLVAPAESLEARLETVHEGLAKGLFALALLHILAAIKHAVWDKDGIFQRMWSWPAGLAAVALLAAGIAFLMPSQPAVDDLAAQAAPEAAEGAFALSSHPAWQISYEDSHIRFTAEQAGAEFTGEWTDWQADIRLQPGELDFSAEVIIATAAVATGDSERDDTLATAEWFDVATFPEATFRSSRMSLNPDGSYTAEGSLTIRERATPVTFQFVLNEAGEQIELTGNADLSRLELGVGTGEWLDTTWVGEQVRVDVRVLATRS